MFDEMSTSKKEEPCPRRDTTVFDASASCTESEEVGSRERDELAVDWQVCPERDRLLQRRREKRSLFEPERDGLGERQAHLILLVERQAHLILLVERQAHLLLHRQVQSPLNDACIHDSSTRRLRKSAKTWVPTRD